MSRCSGIDKGIFWHPVDANRRVGRRISWFFWAPNRRVMHTFVSRRGSVWRVCIDVRLSRKCARKDLVIGSECRPPGRWPDQSIQGRLSLLIHNADRPTRIPSVSLILLLPGKNCASAFELISTTPCVSDSGFRARLFIASMSL
jgi:hypothetical protein